MMTKEMIVALINAELMRQSAEAPAKYHGGLEDDGTVILDGDFDIGLIADVVLGAMRAQGER